MEKIRLCFIGMISYNPVVTRVAYKMQRVFLLIVVAVLLMQGTLWACFSSSDRTVIKAVPMACCAQACQKNTTQEDAQTACIKIALQSDKDNSFMKSAEIDSGFPPVQSSQSFVFLDMPTSGVTTPAKNPLQHRQGLPRYLASHAFLI